MSRSRSSWRRRRRRRCLCRDRGAVVRAGSVGSQAGRQALDTGEGGQTHLFEEVDRRAGPYADRGRREPDLAGIGGLPSGDRWRSPGEARVRDVPVLAGPPIRDVRRPAWTTDASRSAPSASMFCSSTSMVTFWDRSMTATLGWETARSTPSWPVAPLSRRRRRGGRDARSGQDRHRRRRRDWRGRRRSRGVPPAGDLYRRPVTGGAGP